jgi:small subunit ribosomal protein S12e
MSDAGSDSASRAPEEVVVDDVEVAAPAKGAMSVEDALQEVLKNALVHDGLARGLRECAKALDKRQAHLCVLVETCTEGERFVISHARWSTFGLTLFPRQSLLAAEYLKLIEALCAEHNINLIKVSDAKVLGQWSGLAKIDREGNPRKIVGCSCVVVKDYGQESEGLNVLLDYFKSR